MKLSATKENVLRDLFLTPDSGLCTWSGYGTVLMRVMLNSQLQETTGLLY